MSIGGHLPGSRPPFGLHVCASCRNDHADCRPIRLRRVVPFCECPGFDKPPGQPVHLLPCVTKETS